MSGGRGRGRGLGVARRAPRESETPPNLQSTRGGKERRVSLLVLIVVFFPFRVVRLHASVAYRPGEEVGGGLERGRRGPNQAAPALAPTRSLCIAVLHDAPRCADFVDSKNISPPPHRPVRAKFPRRKFFSFAIISARSRQAVRRPQGGRRCSKGLKSFEDGGIHPPLLRLRRDAFAQDAGKAGHKARGSCPARKVAQLQACLRPQSWFWHSRGHREQARGRRERERGRGFDPSQLHFLPCPSDICCTATAVDELLQNYLIYIVRTLGGKPPL